MPAPSRDAAPEVRLVPLAELKPASWNPRTVKTTAFKALCASLEADPEFLWRRPILANLAGEIFGGNQRYRAAEVLGWSAVPAVVEDVPDRLARERALRDNNSSGEWDEQGLAEVLYGLQQEGAALEALAFDHGEVERLLASVGVGGGEEAPDAEVDRAEELQAQWKTAVGQLWVIPSKAAPGNAHRLLCGDSTKAEDVARLMGGERATMSYCDPPYAVGVSTTGLKSSLADLKILVPFFRDWLSCLRTALVNGAHWYIATDWRTYPLVFEVVVPLGLTNCIVWDYDWIKAGSQYRFRYELMMFGVWGDTRRKVPRDEPDVWQHRAENFTVERMHGAQKPIAVMARAIQNSSDPGDCVVDLFAGSGGTLHAAELSHRRGYGMEVDPQYVAVTLERLSKMGLEPRLLSGPS